MNNYWETQQGTIQPELMAQSFKPTNKVGAPFALDFERETVEVPATGFRNGGPKEARLHRVALLASDREVDHLFPVKVENLGPKMTPEKLKARFSEFGEVGDVYLPKNLGTNELKGFAYVRFVRQEDATRALRDAEGIILEKKKGPIRVLAPSEQKTFFSGHTGSAGITGFTEERPTVDKVQFQQVISLDDCMARNGAPWVSKHELLRLEPHAPLETHDCWSVKISPLHPEVTVEQLNADFERFGMIQNAYCPKVLLKDQWSSEANEGVGYVRFKERSNAEAAMRELNDKDYRGTIISMELVPPRNWPGDAPTRRYY